MAGDAVGVEHRGDLGFEERLVGDAVLTLGERAAGQRDGGGGGEQDDADAVHDILPRTKPGRTPCGTYDAWWPKVVSEPPNAWRMAVYSMFVE